MTREPIYAALFNLLRNAAGFATTSRILLHWNDVPAEEQPALFMAQGPESAVTVRGEPTIWTLQLKVYVYVRTDGDIPPGTILNPILDAIEASLIPTPIVNAVTLGGLVHYCRIEGVIETDEGTLGNQAVAIIPIVIKAY